MAVNCRCESFLSCNQGFATHFEGSKTEAEWPDYELRDVRLPLELAHVTVFNWEVGQRWHGAWNSIGL
jgi:hypothetical protein